MKKDSSFGIIPLRKENGIWLVFLIQHSSGSWWGFPKGHQELDETPQETAARELKEETNLEVTSFLPLPSLNESYRFYHDSVLIDKTVTYFPATVEGAIALEPREVTGGKWVALSAAEEFVTYQEAKRICRNMTQSINKD